MARIPYDSETIGGNEVAEFVDSIIKAKALAPRIAARLNINTNDGADAYVLEVGGSAGDVYGVCAGQGINFYNTLLHATTGIITLLNNIPDAELAKVDMGG